MILIIPLIGDKDYYKLYYHAKKFGNVRIESTDTSLRLYYAQRKGWIGKSFLILILVALSIGLGWLIQLDGYNPENELKVKSVMACMLAFFLTSIMHVIYTLINSANHFAFEFNGESSTFSCIDLATQHSITLGYGALDSIQIRKVTERRRSGSSSDFSNSTVYHYYALYLLQNNGLTINIYRCGTSEKAVQKLKVIVERLYVYAPIEYRDSVGLGLSRKSQQSYFDTSFRHTFPTSKKVRRVEDKTGLRVKLRSLTHWTSQLAILAGLSIPLSIGYSMIDVTFESILDPALLSFLIILLLMVYLFGFLMPYQTLWIRKDRITIQSKNILPGFKQESVISIDHFQDLGLARNNQGIFQIFLIAKNEKDEILPVPTLWNTIPQFLSKRRVTLTPTLSGYLLYSIQPNTSFYHLSIFTTLRDTFSESLTSSDSNFLTEDI